MAQLPPKPPRWPWLVPVIAGILLVVGGSVQLWRWLEPVLLADKSVNANTWVGFFGNIVAALLGGVAAVLVLRLSLGYERQKEREEDRRQVVERRLDLADELGDLTGTLNVGAGLSMPEIEGAALHPARLVRKIDRTWADQHEGRHVSMALFNGVAAFREVVDAGLPDEGLAWLRKELFPAIENLTNSMTHRDQVIVGSATSRLLQAVETRPLRSA